MKEVKMARNIFSVRGLKIGHLFEYKGSLYKVSQFPTRRTVVGYIAYSNQKKAPKRVKVSLLSTWALPEAMNKALEAT
jgi:hypothetical protein